MAVPATFTTSDISGKFQQNKALSDDIDKILSLQGVGWVTRKALKAATATLNIKHSTDNNGVEHVDIETSVSGLANISETRVLDWQEREKAGGLVGPVIGKSRKIGLVEVTDGYLKGGWASSANEAGVINIYATSDTAKSGKTWVSEQIWGVQEVDGLKRFARRISFTGPSGEKVTARIVYDYLGPV